MTKKRPPCTSAAEQVKNFQDALEGDLVPPVKLVGDQVTYWNAITRARAKGDWTEIDLFHAANLSKILVLIDEAHETVRVDGSTVLNAKGTPVANPAFSQLNQMTRLAISYSAKLHIHAAATVGSPEDAARRAKEQAKAREQADKVRNSGGKVTPLLATGD